MRLKRLKVAFQTLLGLTLCVGCSSGQLPNMRAANLLKEACINHGVSYADTFRYGGDGTEPVGELLLKGTVSCDADLLAIRNIAAAAIEPNLEKLILDMPFNDAEQLWWCIFAPMDDEPLDVIRSKWVPYMVNRTALRESALREHSRERMVQKCQDFLEVSKMESALESGEKAKIVRDLLERLDSIQEP